MWPSLPDQLPTEMLPVVLCLACSVLLRIPEDFVKLHGHSELLLYIALHLDLPLLHCQVWVSSWLPSQSMTQFHSVACNEDSCCGHYTVMIMMSLVPHRLNHDMPEHVPDFVAYCQETSQPKHKCCFINEGYHSQAC